MKLQVTRSLRDSPVRLFYVLALTLTSVLLLQCNDDDLTGYQADYFPLNEDSSWEMIRKLYGSSWEDYDTIEFRIDGDTIVNDLGYKKFMAEGGLVRLIRNDNGKYYFRDVWGGVDISEEYLFLDEKAAVNSTWQYSDYIQYKVLAVNSVQTINDVVYHHVIEMQINMLDGDNIQSSAVVYYARGFGEIYGAFPYPMSGFYSDMEKKLLKYNP